jgi:hypothetical protein
MMAAGEEMPKARLEWTGNNHQLIVEFAQQPRRTWSQYHYGIRTSLVCFGAVHTLEEVWTRHWYPSQQKFRIRI